MEKQITWFLPTWFVLKRDLFFTNVVPGYYQIKSLHTPQTWGASTENVRRDMRVCWGLNCPPDNQIDTPAFRSKIPIPTGDNR